MQQSPRLHAPNRCIDADHPPLPSEKFTVTEDLIGVRVPIRLQGIVKTMMEVLVIHVEI